MLAKTLSQMQGIPPRGQGKLRTKTGDIAYSTSEISDFDAQNLTIDIFQDLKTGVWKTASVDDLKKRYSIDAEKAGLISGYISRVMELNAASRGLQAEMRVSPHIIQQIIQNRIGEAERSMQLAEMEHHLKISTLSAQINEMEAKASIYREMAERAASLPSYYLIHLQGIMNGVDSGKLSGIIDEEMLEFTRQKMQAEADQAYQGARREKIKVDAEEQMAKSVHKPDPSFQ